MSILERGIDPTNALLAMQQNAAAEISRYILELSMRDAYIAQLEERVQELEGNSGQRFNETDLASMPMNIPGGEPVGAKSNG